MTKKTSPVPLLVRHGSGATRNHSVRPSSCQLLLHYGTVRSQNGWGSCGRGKKAESDRGFILISVILAAGAGLPGQLG